MSLRFVARGRGQSAPSPPNPPAPDASVRRRVAWMLSGALLLATGCASPYRADRGALFGGLTGAGVGALVGSAVGKTAPGAVIGAGLGAVTGGIVGGELDDIEAQNQAEISRQVNAAFPQGTVTLGDVVQMTKAGVDPDVIANHVRTNGFAGSLNAQDLIYLKDQGVDPRVVQALQTPPSARGSRPGGGPPVVVQEHYYGGPYWYPPPYYCAPRPSFGWGVSLSNCW